ncbi:Surface presentation of antigens protein SpaR [Pseudoalteromonas holothuriae]|uniref:Surface presentation of antigens protein SpaR n=1 Tax=Pseudoalteromonas holothuriae TaxID=2963714 RepID=A0A9W4QZV6_9GAMM|nr:MULTISPECIES: flagellar biosynthetic protein FliR [unclassified Pseudoalteromonas]CAH9050986.1 Surface presentation of antigens protein SpaR [Pseudoalteromonas sp. CIP111951]CAH9061647.1 Surface presentation of antigens protein SpaR [Pseudoalteromonas sp. CIP111854]
MDLTGIASEFVLVMSRLMPFFISSGYGPLQRIPGFVRVVLLIAFSIVCCFLIEQQVEVQATQWIVSIIGEFLVGLALFFTLQLAFVTITFWGRVLDMQIGFGAAGVIDPTNKGQDPLLGSIFLAAAICIFYVSGMHYKLIEGIVFSFEVLPVGAGLFDLKLPNFASLITIMFTVGLFMFAPVIILMWCLDMFIGLLSRTMPQMNIYFVMLPLKIFSGLFLLGLFTMHSKFIFERLFNQVFIFWNGMLS